MWRRPASTELTAVLALFAAVVPGGRAAGQAPFRVVAEGLADATALAVSGAESPGSTVVHVAESAAQRVLEFRAAADGSTGQRVAAEGDFGPIAALAAFEDRLLVFGPRGFATARLAEQAEPIRPPEGMAVAGRVATDGRWLFAVGVDQLLRGRIVGARVLPLRAAKHPDRPPSALAFHPLGYLVWINVEGERLSYVDPAAPDQTLAAHTVRGLEAPVDLAYSPRPNPIERNLYALTAEGLYRLEAAGGAPPEARAVRVAGPFASARAMGFAPDGRLFVIDAGEKLLVSEAPL